MDVVLNLVKCVNCRKTLSSPVTLPCGHTICKSHTELQDEHVICSKCNSSHPNKGFVVSEALSSMIKAYLGNTHYKESVKSCESLKEQLDKIDLVLNNTDDFIYEKISDLKNQVHLKCEQLKFKIDEMAQELLDELDEYEKKCKDHHKDNGESNQSFVTLVNEFKSHREETKRKHDELSNVMDEINFDEEKWKKIKVECDSTLSDIQKKFSNFENNLLSKEFNNKIIRIDCFKNINIDLPIFNPFDKSRIIDSSLILTFSNLCQPKFKFDPNNELLYRASRDGFSSDDFHSKCDNQSNTLTIIETTKGYIFGGYTQASWSSSGRYKNDPKAFLFSLVNKFNKPFLCEIKNPAQAIDCRYDFGPLFGKRDIIIQNNSDRSKDNSATICDYEVPSNIPKDPMSIYFCDTQFFNVKEIEVFNLF